MVDFTSYDRLNTVLSKATGTELSCEPADRGIAEEAVELAYRSAKRDGPQRIIWCGSPIAIAKQIAAGSASRQIGRPLKPSMVEAVVGTPAPADHTARPATLSPLSALCVEDADTELFRPSVRLSHLATRLLGSPSILPRSSFREIAAPSEELAAFSASWFLGRGQRRSADAAALVSAIGEISRSASWFAPFENVCWLSEWPVDVRTDGRGRLHCADGPAVRYPDGYAVYSWKGVRIQRWMVERPETITDREVDAQMDEALRDAMIDIMTPERFIATGGVLRVSCDETGTLWRRVWSYRGIRIGTWSAVEIDDRCRAFDGQPKRHFIRVPSHIATARQAVAWASVNAGSTLSF
jgi:hypothetical protein